MAWFLADVGTGKKREFFNTESIVSVSWETKLYRDEDVEGSEAVETVFVELTFMSGGRRDIRLGAYTDDAKTEAAIGMVLGSTAVLELD